MSSAPPVRLRGSLAVAAGVLLADQLTKHWAVNALSDGRPRPVWWTLQWNLAFNSGMAFSRGRGLGPVVGVLALIVVCVLLVSLRRQASKWSRVAVGLVIGGAAGNITDRLFRGEGWLRGKVVDFIDVQWWPIWNVADMGVTIGGVLLVLASLRHPQQARADADVAADVGDRAESGADVPVELGESARSAQPAPSGELADS